MFMNIMNMAMASDDDDDDDVPVRGHTTYILTLLFLSSISPLNMV